jgi:hypothetical protein
VNRISDKWHDATRHPKPATHAALGWSRLPAAYAIPASAPTLAEAREYCARLARSHYENFSVASWFLPRRLRQHFYNVYAYCRISDDLGDEVGDPAASLEFSINGSANSMPATTAIPSIPCSLRCGNGPPLRHSQTRILRPAHRLPPGSNRHPLRNFQRRPAYCKYSANPVGHLVLYLCGYRDPERQQLSDFTCTALQLANFWQDVTVDYAKGRIYLPLEDLRRFSVSEDDIARNQNTPAFPHPDEVRSRARPRLVPIKACR